MEWFCKGFLAFALALAIAGCGNSGSSGVGNTVSVTSAITTGTTGAVYANISTAKTAGGITTYSANAMSITLTSVSLVGTSSTVPSNVKINSITMSLVPRDSVSPRISSPAYKNIPQGVGGEIPGPGTLRIDGIALFGPSDAVTIATAFNYHMLSYAQYFYAANIVFHCTEENTGTKFTVPQTVNMEVDVK